MQYPGISEFMQEISEEKAAVSFVGDEDVSLYLWEYLHHSYPFRIKDTKFMKREIPRCRTTFAFWFK